MQIPASAEENFREALRELSAGGLSSRSARRRVLPGILEQLKIAAIDLRNGYTLICLIVFMQEISHVPVAHSMKECLSLWRIASAEKNSGDSRS